MKPRKITSLLAVMLMALMAETSNANLFTLTENQHLGVVTDYFLGELFDSSTADVRQGGYVMRVWLHNNAALQVLEYRYGTYGQSIGRVSATGNSQVIVSGGAVGSISARENNRIAVSSGEVGLILAFGTSQLTISGGIVSDFVINDSSTLKFYGKNFILGEGLWLDGNQLLGTGILSGQWFDDTFWTTQISSNDETAKILLVPEPATLALLGLGGFWLSKRKKIVF
jgi:hypothetical protein